jgi:hypothetical protein
MGKYGEGANYAKTTNPSSENILDPGTLGGKLRVIQDYAVISAATTLKSTDYIQVGAVLPKGSQVVGVCIGYPNLAAAGGSDGYLKVGDEGDADRYITLVNTSSAGVTRINTQTGMNYVVTGTTDNILRISGSESAVCVNTSGTVKVTIMYVTE